MRPNQGRRGLELLRSSLGHFEVGTKAQHSPRVASRLLLLRSGWLILSARIRIGESGLVTRVCCLHVTGAQLARLHCLCCGNAEVATKYSVLLPTKAVQPDGSHWYIMIDQMSAWMALSKRASFITIARGDEPTRGSSGNPTPSLYVDGNCTIVLCNARASTRRHCALTASRWMHLGSIQLLL